jgi:hypothetical protein
MKIKIKVIDAGIRANSLYAMLSDGTLLEQAQSYRPYAMEKLVADIGRHTGQTDRGVRQTLRINKWIA